MTYVKVKNAELEEVFGEEIRKMKKDGSTGILFFGNQQMHLKDKKLSYGKIDLDKINVQHDSITYFDSLEQANNDMDLEYEEEYILKNVQALQLDLQLSGNPSIQSYDPDQPLSSQTNLKALFNANMDGIVKNKKSEYFTE